MKRQTIFSALLILLCNLASAHAGLYSFEPLSIGSVNNGGGIQCNVYVDGKRLGKILPSRVTDISKTPTFKKRFPFVKSITERFHPEIPVS